MSKDSQRKRKQSPPATRSKQKAPAERAIPPLGLKVPETKKNLPARAEWFRRRSGISE